MLGFEGGFGLGFDAGPLLESARVAISAFEDNSRSLDRFGSEISPDARVRPVSLLCRKDLIVSVAGSPGVGFSLGLVGSAIGLTPAEGGPLMILLESDSLGLCGFPGRFRLPTPVCLSIAGGLTGDGLISSFFSDDVCFAF